MSEAGWLILWELTLWASLIGVAGVTVYVLWGIWRGGPA
jgi:hypothetical protein